MEVNALNITVITPLGTNKGGSGVSSPTVNGILVAQGSSPFSTKVLTNGQILIGSTGLDPVGASLSTTEGLSVTNGAGSVTLNSSELSNRRLPMQFLFMGA